MDLAEDSVLEGEWGLDFEGVLPPGLMLAGEGEDCQGVVISLVE